MSILVRKSNIVYVRLKSQTISDFCFKCDTDTIEFASNYTYLGLVRDEYLDFSATAKHVAKSASRALGLIIAKFKSAGGLPLGVYNKLYNSIVWPVVAYGAAIWGNKRFSCINAIENRAMRFYLGVGKYTPFTVVVGYMEWQPALANQWKCINAFWNSCIAMPSGRLNKQIYMDR